MAGAKEGEGGCDGGGALAAAGADELDGSGHLGELRQASDLDREIELYEKGIRILRFPNSEVFENLEGVLNSIIYAIEPQKSLWADSVVMEHSPQSSP